MKNQKGFSLIELLIVVVIIGIIAAIAIPNLLASRRAANEASAVSNLRTLTGAEATYQATVGQGNFGDLLALKNAGLVDSVLGCIAGTGTGTCEKSGYKYRINRENRVTTGSNPKPAIYDAIADASVLGSGLSGTGTRQFQTSEAGVLYTGMPTAGCLGFDPVTRAPAGCTDPVNP